MYRFSSDMRTTTLSLTASALQRARCSQWRTTSSTVPLSMARALLHQPENTTTRVTSSVHSTTSATESSVAYRIVVTLLQDSILTTVGVTSGHSVEVGSSTTRAGSLRCAGSTCSRSRLRSVHRVTITSATISTQTHTFSATTRTSQRSASV